jgi:hypothetical protein
MIITLGSAINLIGTIGCCTVQVGNTKCLGFVKAPTQLGTTGENNNNNSNKNSCATGEVAFTLVRAPFAFSRPVSSSSSDDFNLKRQLQENQQMQLMNINSSSLSREQQQNEQSSLIQMIKKSIDRSIVFEALPLARFELIVQVLSSTDDDSDLEAITACACGALMDGNIPLKDVFGAGSSNGRNAQNKIRIIVAAHSQGLLGLQSSFSTGPQNNDKDDEQVVDFNQIELLANLVEETTKITVEKTLKCFRNAAAEKITRLKEQAAAKN